ncbi:DNA adenine methylase [Spongisporangium articulatum]|uniref:site-specific DNA-methyltransferase (adenine-specific) n=1 Tax=Spongisporangium articulatum TaxID=3362603 RepID=A0ABW8AGJ1_9ACTN
MDESVVTPAARSGDLRPIHYIGNKSRYLDAIEQAVDRVAGPGRAACDLFAGTSVVSRRLAQSRPVVSADIQTYSQVLARALTRPTAFSAAETEALLRIARTWLDDVRPAFADLLALEAGAVSDADPTRLAALIEGGSFELAAAGAPELEQAKRRALESADSARTTLTWYYGGVYFSYAQALELDALRHAIRGDGRDDTAVAAVMGAASDAVSTVGNHFAQPVQPRRRDGSLKGSWVTSVARRRQYSVLDGFARRLARYAELTPTAHPCTAVRSDFQETLSALGPEVGVIYADPPYTRDHYSRFYHVLETIALDDDPGVSLAPGTFGPSRGLYRAERHQSPFSIRTQARPSFRHLMAEAKRLGVPLVLSYSPMSAGTKARPETRLISVHDLVSIAGDYFTDVSLVDVEASSHSRFNRVDLGAEIDRAAEILVVGQN